MTRFALLVPLVAAAPAAAKSYTVLGGQTVEVPGEVRGLRYAPDNKTLAVAAGHVHLVNAAAEKPFVTATLFAHNSGGARSLAFSPRGRFLYAGCADGHVRAWDIGADTPVPVGTYKAHAGAVNGLAFAREGGPLVISAGDDGAAVVWTVAEDGSLARKSAVAKPDGVFRATGLAALPRERKMYVMTTDGYFRLYDYSYEPPRLLRSADLGGGTAKVAIGGIRAGGIAFAAGTSMSMFGVKGVTRLNGEVVGLGYTPDRVAVVALDASGSLRFYDARGRRLTGTLVNRFGPPTCLATMNRTAGPHLPGEDTTVAVGVPGKRIWFVPVGAR